MAEGRPACRSSNIGGQMGAIRPSTPPVPFARFSVPVSRTLTAVWMGEPIPVAVRVRERGERRLRIRW